MSAATSVPKQAAEVAAGHRIALRRWRSRVHAYVGTHHVHVELRELGRRLDWRTVRTLRRAIGPGPAATLADAVGSLGEALHALRTLVDGAAGEDFGRAACDVVLADAWLVYDVIDIDLATLSPTLAQQAVSAALADIAGLPSESLHVRWQRQRAGRSVFGMAIARDDLDLLQRELAGHGLRLAAVTGEIISVLRAQRSRLPAERAIVAIGRTAGTQLAALSAGEIAAVQFEAGALGPGALPAVAQRVIRARGLEAGASMQYCVDLCAGDMDSFGSHPDAAAGAGGSPPGWQWLPAPAWVRPA